MPHFASSQLFISTASSDFWTASRLRRSTSSRSRRPIRPMCDSGGEFRPSLPVVSQFRPSKSIYVRSLSSSSSRSCVVSVGLFVSSNGNLTVPSISGRISLFLTSSSVRIRFLFALPAGHRRIGCPFASCCENWTSWLARLTDSAGPSYPDVRSTRGYLSVNEFFS